MIHALAAESLLCRRRPMSFVVGGAWVLMVLAFAFGVPYIVYSVLDPAEAADRAALLDTLLPASLPATAASTYPMFGGAIMLVLGVLMTGPEYRWNTWTARFTQGPGRAQVVLAKLVVGAVIAVVTSVVVMVVAAIASFAVAGVEGASMAPPGIGGVAASIGVAALVSVAWMSVGAALGVVFRGTTVALTVGLLWTLGLEKAISGLATMLGALESVQALLLGSASGSLVASLGAPTQGEGGTPGVVDHVGPATACLVLVLYIALSAVVAVTVSRRRDIT